MDLFFLTFRVPYNRINVPLVMLSNYASLIFDNWPILITLQSLQPIISITISQKSAPSVTTVCAKRRPLGFVVTQPMCNKKPDVYNINHVYNINWALFEDIVLSSINYLREVNSIIPSGPQTNTPVPPNIDITHEHARHVSVDHVKVRITPFFFGLTDCSLDPHILLVCSFWVFAGPHRVRNPVLDT